MTTNQQPSADALAASDEVLDRVAQDVFFNKMAAAGFPAQSAEHGASMIQDALLVRQMLEQPTVKQAYLQNSPTAVASAHLQKLASDFGLSSPEKQVDQDAEYVKLAYAYSQQVPDVYAAGLLAGLSNQGAKE